MRPNPLAGACLPTFIDVGGEKIPLDWSWQAGVRIKRALDSVEHPVAKAEAALRIAFGEPLPREVARDKKGSLKALISWLDCNEPVPPPTPQQRRLASMRSFDWDYDASAVIADFQRFYGIDLTNPQEGMHWWRFWSLFRELPADGQVKTLAWIRTSDEDGMKGDSLRRIREGKRRAALPARTEEEALKNMELMQG